MAAARLLPVLALAFLAGCGDKPPPPPPPPPPAPPAPEVGVSDFSGPLDLGGISPFAWSGRIRGTGIVLAQSGQADVAAQAPGAVIQPGRATWRARTAAGEPLDVILYVADCYRGQSDLRYPMAPRSAMARPC